MGCLSGIIAYHERNSLVYCVSCCNEARSERQQALPIVLERRRGIAADALDAGTSPASTRWPSVWPTMPSRTAADTRLPTTARPKAQQALAARRRAPRRRRRRRAISDLAIRRLRPGTARKATRPRSGPERRRPASRLPDGARRRAAGRGRDRLLRAMRRRRRIAARQAAQSRIRSLPIEPCVTRSSSQAASVSRDP